MSRKHSPGYKAIVDYILHGEPLNEAFILEAFYRYANQVVHNPNAVRDQLKNNGINHDAWIQCAKDALAVMDKHFKKLKTA